MRFHEAMKLLDEGTKVRCVDWDKSWFLEYKNGNGFWNFDWSIPIGRSRDILHYFIGCTWEEYQEPVQFLTFSEVVKGLLQGKKYARNDWSEDNHIFLKREVIQYCFDPGMYSPWHLYPDNFQAVDWYEVKE